MENMLKQQINMDKLYNFLKILCSSKFSKNFILIFLLFLLICREKPNDVEWCELDLQRRPILLNFIQCKLKLDDFYPAIEHATTILDSDPSNIKARYRRAKAHVAVWNVDQAKNDYNYLLSNISIDENFRKLIQQELQQLIQAEHDKYKEDKSRLSGKLFT